MGGGSGVGRGGGGSSSQSAPQKLMDSAKKQLKSRGIDIGDKPWDAAVEKLAELIFAESYPYPFDIMKPSPREAAPGGAIKALKDFCNVEINRPGMDAGIRYYIDTVLLKGANVPKKMRDRAAQDLFDEASSLVKKRSVVGPNEWQQQRYTRTFQRDKDDDAISGNNTAIQVDGVFLFCITEFKQDNQPKELLVIYYMAVYYEVTSDTTNRRDRFTNDAIAQAKELTNTMYPIRDETGLRDALQAHCQNKFKEQYGFDYEGSPPNAIARPTRHSDWKQNDQVHSKMKESIKKWSISYCDKFDFTDDTVREKIQGRLNDQLQTILTPVNKGGVWVTYPVSVTIEPTTGGQSVNTKIFNGFVYYFTNLATTGEDYDVSLTYVFIMGVFYETKALGQTVLADLYDQLIRNLPDLNEFSFLLSEKNTKLRQTLADLAFENASILFRRNHKFAWKSHNPRLPTRDETFVTAYSELFDFNNRPTGDEIERKVEALFQDDDTLSDNENRASERLRDDLRDKIEECARAVTASSEENQWQVAKTSKVFVGDKSPKRLKHYAIYLYVYGVRSTRGTATRQFLVYYLSVITAPKK